MDGLAIVPASFAVIDKKIEKGSRLISFDFNCVSLAGDVLFMPSLAWLT